MKTLSIWGGIDDLPSIDPECVAVLAYALQNSCLDDINIVCNHDPSLSPNGTFPLLTDGSGAFAGFSSITNQIPPSPSISPDLQAVDIAWCSFISTRGQALLDLYLYVSSTNYWDHISPAYTKILPWYANYIHPPAHRAAAITRMSPLGIRSLDLDSIDEYTSTEDVRGRAGSAATAGPLAGIKSPEELMKKQKSARWLQRQKQSDTFQLYQLTRDFFEPLQDLLGEKKYLLSEHEPTTVDCVALGYLSLMLKVQVPQPWLREALERHTKLKTFTERMYKQIFDDAGKAWRKKLRTADEPTIAQASRTIGRGILDWTLPALRNTVVPDPGYQFQNSRPSSLASLMLPPLVFLPLGVLAGIAFGVVKYLQRHSPSNDRITQTFRVEERDSLPPTFLSDIGESGAFMRALRQEMDVARDQEINSAATIVEVAVENENGDVGSDVIINR